MQLSPVSPEIGDEYGRLHIELPRMGIVRCIVRKHLQPYCVKIMKVSLPKEFSPKTPAYADLQLSYISYMKEYTEWPERYFHLRLQLKIPIQFVHSLTVNHVCSLYLKVCVTSSGCGAEENDLLVNHCAQEKEIVLPAGKDELNEVVKTTLRHSKLIDSTCDKVIFKTLAKFNIKEGARDDLNVSISYDKDFVIYDTLK